MIPVGEIGWIGRIGWIGWVGCMGWIGCMGRFGARSTQKIGPQENFECFLGPECRTIEVWLFLLTFPSL